MVVNNFWVQYHRNQIFKATIILNYEVINCLYFWNAYVNKNVLDIKYLSWNIYSPLWSVGSQNGVIALSLFHANTVIAGQPDLRVTSKSELEALHLKFSGPRLTCPSSSLNSLNSNNFDISPRGCLGQVRYGVSNVMLLPLGTTPGTALAGHAPFTHRCGLLWVIHTDSAD